MSSGADISTLYREFIQALTDVWWSGIPWSTRKAALKKHPEYSEHGYFLAVETAFKQWETMQTVGHIDQPSQPE